MYRTYVLCLYVYICSECLSLPWYICISAKHMSICILCTYVRKEYVSGCLCESMHACIFECDSWALCLYMHTYICVPMHILR